MIEWFEYIIPSGIGVFVLGKIIKDEVDKKEFQKDIDTLKKFKEEMEENTLVTVPYHEKESSRCRNELFNSIEKISKFYEEAMNRIETKLERDDNAIRKIQTDLVRVLTILEEGKKK